MKAAGGISSLEDAEKFLALGADRLGTSRIIKIVKMRKPQDIDLVIDCKGEQMLSPELIRL